MTKMDTQVMRLQLNFAGKVALSRLFQKVPVALEDMSEPLRMVSKSLRSFVGQRFDMQGAHEGGNAWAELTEPYATNKMKKYGPWLILQLPTQYLYKSFTQPGFTSEAGDMVEEIDEKSLIFGTSVYYAFWHQFGTKKMVARPPLEMSEDEKKEIVQIIRKYVWKKTKELEKEMFSAQKLAEQGG